MLNLVEGDEARITSPAGAFAPFTVHYAQTFILPEAAGAYRLESPDGRPSAPSWPACADDPCTITAAPAAPQSFSAARLFLPARPVCQRGGGGV